VITETRRRQRGTDTGEEEATIAKEEMENRQKRRLTEERDEE
jgi:hypothetical protein